MASKMVLVRQKSSAAVQAAGQTYDNEMVKSIVDILGPNVGPAARTPNKDSHSLEKNLTSQQYTTQQTPKPANPRQI